MPAHDGSVADLAVDLEARNTLLIPGARYEVSITNHGPDPVTSATVVVTLDPRTMRNATAPCVLDADADTLTCTFGQVPAGSTATMTGLVYFIISGAPAPIDATATRTTSAPADPNAGNDTDTKRCWFQGSSVPPPPPSPPLRC